MANIEVLVTTISAFILYQIAAGLLYYRFKHLNAKHLNLVSLGVIVQSLLPLSFIPLGILEGEQYSTFVNIVGIFGGVCILVGMLIVAWNLKIHQRSDVPQRYLGMMFLLAISISQVITGTTFVWNGSDWIIERTLLVRVMMFIGTAWVIYELTRVFIIGVMVKANFWSYAALSYPIGLIAGFVLIAFREQLPFGTTFYQVPSAVGTAVFCLALLRENNLLIIPNVTVSRITVANRKSGMTRINLPDNPETLEESLLTTAAITGISQIIQEISGKEHLPSKLGYADYNIGIYSGENIFIYSISNGTHPILDAWLSYITKNLDSKVNGETNFDELENEFKNDVERRLDLFLKTT